MEAADRLIVALDFPSATEALALVDRLDATCKWFKIGLELYLGAGPSLIEHLLHRNYKIFLDLKLHDIPNTVAAAVRSVSTLGVSLLTLHALGGPAMLSAAREAAECVPGAPGLLAVTILTSMDVSQLQTVGIPDNPQTAVLRLSRMAHQCGIAGMVCSANELQPLRAELGEAPLLVVPGIRPADSQSDDQKRTATPAEAIALGASFLVVGRPITRAADPAAATRAILSQIAASG